MSNQQLLDAPAAEHETSASVLEVLRNGNFLKIWLAQILCQTAQQIVNIALVLQMDQLTHSSAAVSGIIVCFTLPAILFAAIAGVFVERRSKRVMLMLTNVGRGLMVLLYVLPDPHWGAGVLLPYFYIATFAFATVSQFFNPAEAAMIPLLVSRRELVSANSLFNLTLPATQLGGFVILGPLLLSTVFHNNFDGLYVVIFGLCIAAAALTYFLPHDNPHAALARQYVQSLEAEEDDALEEGMGHRDLRGGYRTPGTATMAEIEAELAAVRSERSRWRAAWEELAEGWQFIRSDAVIMRAILYWSTSIAVFMMLGAIGPGFLEHVLGIDQSMLIYVLLPAGVGLVIGVVLVGRTARPDNREAMINWSLLAAGVTVMAFSLLYPVLVLVYGGQPPQTLVLVLMGLLTLLLGLSNNFIAVPAQTAMQERSPEYIRARVFSAFYTVSNAMLIAPVLFAGALADILGYVQTVLFIGALMLGTALLGLVQMYRSRR